ncbi:hydrolase, TatD family [Bacteroidales bacterium KA00344]|nr:hydrolase, TatD family [Bacteroidales bacterium KA00344]
MDNKITFVDTHAHLDGEEYQNDLPEVISRAKQSGVGAVFVPAINRESIVTVMKVCRQHPGFCFPMLGLQPEEVKEDWQEVLSDMKQAFEDNLCKEADSPLKYIAIGECGLDFYWSRQFEKEQLQAFEKQLEWSIEFQLPLMIHCRKAQNEMLHVMQPYVNELPGGVFHCFTGNQKEAERFLQLDRFCLGIGGVSTFKSSHLREDLPAAVPLQRIVLETDSPYMASVPFRGKRNESAFAVEVLKTLAQSYNVSESEVATITNNNVYRLFGVSASA